MAIKTKTDMAWHKRQVRLVGSGSCSS